jgi:hypothetical protein
MKYLFKPVPDPNGDGFVMMYLEAISKIIRTNRYRLEIDYDLCAPIETWTLINYYAAVTNGKAHTDSYRQQVYHGKELTEAQRDILVELVMDHEHLDYGEFIDFPTASTNENTTTSI